MPACEHDQGTPAAFELQTGKRTMRYAAIDGVIAAASTFGGRWRVTAPSGDPLFSLAPVGAPGTDDREVVPNGESPLAAIMRDRRQAESWVVSDPRGEIVLRAVRNGPYEVTLTDPEGVPVGRVFATATSIVVELGTPPDGIHCVVLALPLYFATTGALRVESLDAPTPDLALWGVA